MVLMPQLPSGSQCLSAIITGICTILPVILAAWFALWRYHSEQRTSRLQKLYFEDTFLGQAKAIEDTMAQTNRNMLLTEALFNLAYQLLDLLKNNVRDLELTKKDLEAIFNSASYDFEAKFYPTDFKKETISKLYYESVGKAGSNYFYMWIEQFEQDAYRFYQMLRSQIFIVTTGISDLEVGRTQKFEKLLLDISKYIQSNYFLIKRHYILLGLLSEFVLEFASKKYSSINKIRKAIKKNKLKKVIELINFGYEEVVVNFQDIYIGAVEKINDENIKKLEDKIESVNGMVTKELYSHDNDKKSI